MKKKAVALLSGGLDSLLAVRTLLEQGVPVTGVRFITHFGCDPVSSGSCGRDVEPLVKAWGPLGFTVRMSHLGQDYIEMVKNPKFGRGKNMNPCVDCRLMMLDWARDILDQEEAGFLITGEVLNQRPMSQTRERFRQIDKALKLEGLVLRPLSAKLLEPTRPELEGVVDRSRLLDISGRGRQRQYALAKHYGITDIPQPAGGCLLTDPGYSARLRDLWDHDPEAGGPDINLLRVGRHFRPSASCKVIVARDENECRALEAFQLPGDTLVYLKDHQGPQVLLRGRYGAAEIRLAGGLAVRYGDVPGKVPAEVVIARKGGLPVVETVECAREEDYVPMRLGTPKP
ncbi:MAG TPA: tRNA (5-methylaminomethyl-2-thiouridylate)-methyltransferase [Planctomycetota bacterium]|nr:tRNA (5-methylaminomethyl-2-thiouridylate)-methyltransferase [Planctomycetota bacterium]